MSVAGVNRMDALVSPSQQCQSTEAHSIDCNQEKLPTEPYSFLMQQLKRETGGHHILYAGFLTPAADRCRNSKL